MKIKIKKSFLFISLLIFNINLSASSSSSSDSDNNAISSFSNLNQKDETEYIIIPRDSEEIVSYRREIYTVPTQQQALVSCPNNPSALNCVKQKKDPNCQKIKIEDQVLLSSIMEPVLQYMKKELDQKSMERPYAFMVKGGTAVPAKLSELKSEVCTKMFLLDNDPITKQWFGDTQKHSTSDIRTPNNAVNSSSNAVNKTE